MTDSERWLRLVLALAGPHGAALPPIELCDACKRVLDVDGVSITLMDVGDQPLATYTSDVVLEPLEKEQFTLGIGPGLEAHRLGVAVVVPEMVDAETEPWQSFATLTINSGFQSVSALPLRLGAVRLGTMMLYFHRAGPMDDYRFADALVVARIVTQLLLVFQSDHFTGESFGGLDEGSIDYADVHQAAGMVSVQLDVAVGEALVRLRARAFADGVSVHESAVAVIERRLRFSQERTEFDGI